MGQGCCWTQDCHVLHGAQKINWVTKEFLLLITIVQTLSCVFAAVVFFINDASFRKEFAFFGAALVASALSDVLQFIFYFGLGINPNFIINIYCFFEVTFLCLLYRKQLDSIVKPIIVDCALASLLLFTLINVNFFQGWAGLNSVSRTPQGIAMIVFSLIYFYSLLKSLPTKNVQRLPMFWINIGILFYYAGIFFVLIFTDYMVNVLKNDLVSPWTFHNFLGIVHNIIFALGLWLNRRNHKSA